MISLLFFTMSHSADAMDMAKDGCPKSLTDVNVKVNITEGPVYRNNAISLDNLQIKARQGGHVPQKGGQLTYGLTSSNTFTEVKGQFQTVTDNRAKTGCFWTDNITVTVGLDITVDIPDKFPAGSCAYNHIMEHEMNHVEVERKIMYYYAPIIRDKVRKAVDAIGVRRNIPADNLNTEVDRMNTYLNGVVRAEIDRKNSKRDSLQHKLDTDQEYTRISRLVDACPL